MNDRFFALLLFVRVGRTGSFSVAGRELGVSQPTASRIVAALERKVGAALLTRTTRAVTLTEAGVDYLARAEAILAALDEADHEARGTGELRGILRVATSSAFAVHCILPRLSNFSDPHPNLRIEFMLTDQRQDLIGDAVDVALRVGTLADFDRGGAQDRRHAPRPRGSSVLSRTGRRPRGADSISRTMP